MLAAQAEKFTKMAKDQHSLKMKLIAKNGARVEDVNIRFSMNSEFLLIFNLQRIECEHSNDDNDDDKKKTTPTTSMMTPTMMTPTTGQPSLA